MRRASIWLRSMATSGICMQLLTLICSASRSSFTSSSVRTIRNLHRHTCIHADLVMIPSNEASTKGQFCVHLADCCTILSFN